jgi:hypothetical protein
MSVIGQCVSAISIGLQDGAPGGKMLPWMFARAVARLEEHRTWRRPATERAVVAHVGPTSPSDSLAPGQHRHGRVVAVQPLGRHHVRQQALMERQQDCAAGPDLIGQRRQAEWHPFAGVALGLAVERLMLAVLLEQDHRQQAGAGPTSGDHTEGRRLLADALAVAAREFSRTIWITFHWGGGMTSRVSVMSSPSFDRRVPPQQVQAVGRHDDALARQMLGEWLARRALAGEGRDGRGPRHRLLGGQLILGRRGFEFLELQLELIEQSGAALGALAEALPVELLDPQSLRWAIKAWSSATLARSVADSATAEANSFSRASSSRLRLSLSFGRRSIDVIVATQEHGCDSL